MRAFELYVGITMASTISASNAPYPGKINNMVRRIDGALNTCAVLLCVLRGGAACASGQVGFARRACHAGVRTSVRESGVLIAPQFRLAGAGGAANVSSALWLIIRQPYFLWIVQFILRRGAGTELCEKHAAQGTCFETWLGGAERLPPADRAAA